ncbi:MAG: hypothetical protein JST39_04355 [Bacteroidetes bacterium]|nr:hypothetical protein [Bacteroidota bacterium]
MENALERLDSLIIKRIEPETIRKLNYSDEQLFFCLHTAYEECDRIRLHLLQYAEQTTESDYVERLLRHYQTSLVHLLDTLTLYKTQGPNENTIRIYDALENGLEELLQYIRKRFDGFFNIEGKVSDFAQALAKDKMKNEWIILQERIARQELNDELVEAATEPINLFLNGKFSDNVTYRWFGYMTDLMAHLTEWSNGRYDNPEWELISLLLYMDLNSRKCRAYCIGYIVGFTDEIVDARHKLDRLEWLYKRSLLIQKKPNTIFDSRQTSLKEHILQWILTEIEFTKKKIPPDIENEGVKETATSAPKPTKKIMSSLTVPEHGAWVRAQMDAGVILNGEVKEVMEVISATHETPHSAKPSWNTLSRKSGELAVQSIKKLQQMARLMDKHFTDMLRG